MNKNKSTYPTYLFILPNRNNTIFLIGLFPNSSLNYWTLVNQKCAKIQRQNSNALHGFHTEQYD